MMENYGEMPAPIKSNAIIEICKKYRNEVNSDITDDKLKVLIGESIDEIINEKGDLGSMAGWYVFTSKEVYNKTILKVNKYLLGEYSEVSEVNQKTNCNLFDCCTQISTEQEVPQVPQVQQEQQVQNENI